MKRSFAALTLLLASGMVGAYLHYGPPAVTPLIPDSVESWLWGDDQGGTIKHRTALPEIGNIVPSVIATGVIEPVTIVQVGTQVSGQITRLLADFNSKVRRGEVIAVFDRRDFQNNVEQTQAELDYAEATLQIQHASLDRAQAEHLKAQSDLEASKAMTQQAGLRVEEQRKNLDRQKILAVKGSKSTADLETAEYAYESSRSGLRMVQAQEIGQVATVQAVAAQIRNTQAQIEATQATIRQKTAALARAKTDLQRTLIVSPIEGTVIDRMVEVGQTIAANFETPTLFSIAQDLSQMQIKVSVDEADVGRIQEGQRVLFTVDAYPEQTFEGEVLQIRQNPVVVQYVVTYTVVVSAPNPDLMLKPGMTANARIVLAERENILRVPNAALRYRPPGQQLRGPHVWTLEGGIPKPISVQIGLSDETYSEIRGDITPETVIIVGQDFTAPKKSNSKVFGLGN